MLEKYPVVTDIGEYKVIINIDVLPLNDGTLKSAYEAVVYKKEQTKILKRDKWVFINRLLKEADVVENEKDGFINLTKEAIKNYEERQYNLSEEEKIVNARVKEFVQWDGDARSNKKG